MAVKIKFPRGPWLDPDVENPPDINPELVDTGDLLPVENNTPFGRYEKDPKFRKDAKKFTLWAARRLGWPTMSIEIDERDFYAALEEATDEFSRLVNDQNIQDNLEAILGSDANRDLTGRWVSSGGSGQMLQLARDYGGPLRGREGGNVTWERGFFETEVNRQIYTKSEIKVARETSMNEFEYVPVEEEVVIHRIFHQRIPSSVHGHFGGAGGAGFGGGTGGGQAFGGLSGFGALGGAGYTNQGGGSYAVDAAPYYTMYPLYDSTLATQQADLYDKIYTSDYSFDIIGDKIKIHPSPHSRFRIWVEFVPKDEALGVEVVGESTARAEVGDEINNVVSDYSDAPYDFIPYRYINASGKRWIYKYALAVAKHKLGTVRSKFSDMPSPQDPFQLDGQDLKQQAQQEMERSVDNLKDRLQKISKEERIKRKADMAENLNRYLQHVPTLIYRSDNSRG